MDDATYKAVLDQCRDLNGQIQTEATRRAEVASGPISPIFAASETFVNALDAEKTTLQQ